MGTVPPTNTAPHLRIVPDPPLGVARTELPGWAKELVARGLSPAEIRVGKRWAVIKALGRTAASAMQHGKTFEDWRQHVVGGPEGQPSALAHQYRLSRPGRPHTWREVDKDLRGIWRRAEQWVYDNPPAYTERQVLARLDEVRVALRESGLGPNDRRLMRAVLDIAEERVTLTPAAPLRELIATSGLGDRSVRNGLRRLTDGGWLMVVSRGRSAAPVKGVPGRATIYRVRVPWVPEPLVP